MASLSRPAVGPAAILACAVSGSAGSTVRAALLLIGSLRAWFLPQTHELHANPAHARGVSGNAGSEAGLLNLRLSPWLLVGEAKFPELVSGAPDRAMQAGEPD